MRRAGCILLGLVAVTACKSDVTEQGVVVNVTNVSAVPGIVWLKVSVSNKGTPDTLYFPPNPRSTAIKFPTAFSIAVPADRGGEVDIAVVAYDSSMAVVANGASFAILKTGYFVPTEVALKPGASLCGNLQPDPGET